MNIKHVHSDHLHVFAFVCVHVHSNVQIIEWTKCVVKKLESWFNVFVKLMLFHNIKRSLKVLNTYIIYDMFMYMY